MGPRCREVADLLAQGLTERQITEALDMSLVALRSHLVRLRETFDVHTSLRLAQMLRSAGLPEDR